MPTVNRVPIGLLRGIDRVRDILLANTERFAAGLPANNVLLWGARGTGKSALVKAAHAAVNEARPERSPGALALIEIHREDIPTLPRLLSLVRDSGRRCDPVLRRPVVRPERRQLQIAEGGARRRHRGAARPMSCSTRPRTAGT